MKEEALLQSDINQDHFDMLMVNLRMDSVFVKENMKIRWISEAGIIENLANIVKEYRESRKLLVCCLTYLHEPKPEDSLLIMPLFTSSQ